MLSETTAKRYWAPPCRGPWAMVPLHGGARVMVRPAIIEAVKAMDAVFRRYDYRAYANQTGAQNCRRVKGISSMSLHAYGIAIDVNWQCVTGDTMITTWDGPKPIGELVDQKVRLLTRHPYEGGASRWVDSPIFSYGVAPVKEVVLSRRGLKRKVKCTDNHRWFITANKDQAKKKQFTKEVATSELNIGDSILGCLTPPVAFRTKTSTVGVMAGLVYGDGSKETKNRGSYISLFDTCMELTDYFPKPNLHHGETSEGTPYIKVSSLPGYFKDAPPEDESASYLLGWLAGYFAADGCVSKTGQASICSAKRSDLELFKRIAAKVGIACGDIKATERMGINNKISTKYNMSILPYTTPEHFFILSRDIERFNRRERKTDRYSWKVESIEDAGEEEVFCPYVESTEAFCLDGWILTGNSNPYGGYRRHIPDHVARAVCSIRTNNGKQVWGWGGYWSGKKDWMHFSICCTPGDLATGINWRTVTGTPSGHIPAPPSRTPTPKPAPTKPAPPQFPIFQDEGDDEDMRLLRDHTGAVWILSGRTRKHVKTANEYKALKSTWMPHHDLGPGSPFFNPIVSQVILNYTDAV